MLIGAQVAGKVEQQNSPPAVAEFGAKVAELESQLKEVQAKIDSGETEELVVRKVELETQKNEARMSQLKVMNWKSLWLFPAVFAAGVLGVFLLLFRDTSKEDAE